MSVQEPVKGQLETVEFNGKIIAVKRKCSCGGDVVVRKDPERGGNIAECKSCGVSLHYGGGK
jgi:hypothetical protein